IFHVNGEDPEAVAHVVQLACEYRAKFAQDVVIDLYCWRKYGHNEADEPSFTQPLLYRRIEQKESPFAVYARRLVDDGVLAPAEVTALTTRLAAELEAELTLARTNTKRPVIESFGGVWAGYTGGPEATIGEVATGVTLEQLTKI